MVIYHTRGGAYVKICFDQWLNADWDVSRGIFSRICVGGACVVKNCEIGEVAEILTRRIG
jgi:hypothetical protein